MKIREFNDNLQEVNLGGMLAAAGGAVERGLDNVGQAFKNKKISAEREKPKQDALTTGQKISHDPMNAQRKIDMYEKQLKNLVNKFYQASFEKNTSALIKTENQYNEILKLYKNILQSNKPSVSNTIGGEAPIPEQSIINILKNELLLEILQNPAIDLDIFFKMSEIMKNHIPGNRDQLQQLHDEYAKLGKGGVVDTKPSKTQDTEVPDSNETSQDPEVDTDSNETKVEEPEDKAIIDKLDAIDNNKFIDMTKRIIQPGLSKNDFKEILKMVDEDDPNKNKEKNHEIVMSDLKKSRGEA